MNKIKKIRALKEYLIVYIKKKIYYSQESYMISSQNSKAKI